jgi:elongation factor Ts
LRDRLRGEERELQGVLRRDRSKDCHDPGADLEADRIAAVQRIGENILIRRSARLEVTGNGLVAAYIHTGGKVGVLVEVGAEKESTAQNEDFKQLVRDITLQIAAANPICVERSQVSQLLSSASAKSIVARFLRGSRPISSRRSSMVRWTSFSVHPA